jgi:hypothetical protein
MKNEPHRELLNDVLIHGEAAEFRNALLERGLGYLRRRERRRKIGQGCLAVLAIAATAWLVVQDLDDEPVRIPPAVIETTAPVAADKPPPLEMIDDKELQALFPDKVLALIGPPGDQRLLVFDIPEQRL